MKRRGVLGCVLRSAALAGALGVLGCSSTLDSLGTDLTSGAGGAGAGSGGTGGAVLPDTLRTVKGPDTYDNAFGMLLAKSDGEISTKIENAFQQLFYGTSDDLKDDQVIYYEHHAGALILDVLHGDVRTEGIGLAMLITVELGKREEFDLLWRYAKAIRQLTSGPGRGYFTSRCDDDTVAPCLDSYGMQQFVLALMLADARWHSTADAPYAKDAIALLDLLQHGIGDTFDAETHLVREQPSFDPQDYTRSSLEMPAAYWYWGEATGNTFWSVAADAARAHLLSSANAKTGLWPMRSNFNAAPAGEVQRFTEQAYRTQLNLALDALWGKAGPEQTDLANRLLDFFASKGLDTYGATYELDGTPVDTNRSQALVSANGALAVAASNPNRTAFVTAVWEQAIPSGANRYYDGLLYLMSLLTLSGRLQVAPH